MVIEEVLNTIGKKGNLYELTSKGYRPSQIVLLINEVIDKDFVIYSDDKLQLTEKGRNKLNNYYFSNNLRGIYRWLPEREEYRLTPIKKYDILLPK